MQFETRMKRTLWSASALGAIPDIIIAIIVALVFGGGYIGFFATLIGLQVLYLGIWTKNSVWSWIVFSYGGGRKRLALLLSDYLRENGYPEPNIYEKSADGYFESVVDNERLPIIVRLKAASEIGAMKFLDASCAVQKSMQISMAYEDALEEFKRSFPQTEINPPLQPASASEYS
ncbi:hypothetical protein [Herminiimonas sp. CN]|uniref:hypothetical protein n=1 Tax=Herminiimonas sp. CN TaxID=1349818 RepID=UPI0012DC90C6|nr:hypothetical protein [Herminiimonas sp. CN]